VGQRTGGGLGGCAVERRGPPLLHYDAMRARGIDRAQDRANVVRILDPVEHDDERGALGVSYQFLDTPRRDVLDLRHDTLVHAATRVPIQHVRRHASYSYSPLGGERQHLPHAIAAPIADTQLLDAPGAESLDDGINPVDDHGRREGRTINLLS
jgi:hypothetical protein